MLLEAGKRQLSDAVESSGVSRIGGMRIVGNSAGSSLLEDMKELKSIVSRLSDQVQVQDARIANLESDNANLEARVAELERDNANLNRQVASLLPFKRLFIDVRERLFLTFVRDTYTNIKEEQRRKGTEGHAVHSRITSLNKNLIHGGNAEADAIMFFEREPVKDLCAFQKLYGELVRSD